MDLGWVLSGLLTFVTIFVILMLLDGIKAVLSWFLDWFLSLFD